MNPLRQTRSMDRHLRSSTGKTGVVRPPPPPTTPKPQKKSRLSVPDEGIEAQAIDTSTETADVSVSTPQIDVPADQQMDESAASSKTADKKNDTAQKVRGAFDHEGHSWHKNKDYKDTTYYCCAQLKAEGCKVTLSAKKNKDGSYTYKQNGAAHTHTLDVRDQMAKPSHSGTNDEMPAKQKAKHLPAPKSLAELVLPNVLTTAGENFVLYDSRNDFHKDDLNNRIIVLATQSALDFLATCDTIFLEGISGSAPMLFEQMYTIHGCRKNWRIPVAFVLNKDKQKKSHKVVFEQLKKCQPQFKPKKVNIDIDLASKNAVTEVFPDATVQCSHFYMKQSVIRNLDAVGLKSRYESDPKFAQEVLQMVAVAFLPEEKVISTWERFIEMSEYLNKEEQQKDSAIGLFVNDFFCKHFIGILQDGGQRKRPRFAIGLWNVHSSTLNDEPKTNSANENWKHTFASVSGVRKPNIYKFIDDVKKDEGDARVKMDSCMKEYPAAPQNRKDVEKNDAIKNSLRSYVKQTAASIEKNGSSDEEEDDELGDEAMGGETENSRDKWLKTPEMVLLMAIAHNSRI